MQSTSLVWWWGALQHFLPVIASSTISAWSPIWIELKRFHPFVIRHRRLVILHIRYWVVVHHTESGYYHQRLVMDWHSQDCCSPLLSHLNGGYFLRWKFWVLCWYTLSIIAVTSITIGLHISAWSLTTFQAIQQRILYSWHPSHQSWPREILYINAQWIIANLFFHWLVVWVAGFW